MPSFGTPVAIINENIAQGFKSVIKNFRGLESQIGRYQINSLYTYTD